MKLCIDCRHYLPYNTGPDTAYFARCAVEKEAVDNHMTPVDGRVPKPKQRYCSAARSCIGQCGPDAKLFEPKEKAT